MLIKGSDYRIYNIDEGSISRLWMPTKGGLDRPTQAYIDSLTLLRRHGIYILEPGQLAGGSGFSGGGGGGTDTNTFVIPWTGDLANGFSPAAGVVIAHGNGAQRNPSDGSNGLLAMRVPIAATLKSAYWYLYRTGTAGTAGQNATHVIRKNDTTDTAGVTFDWNANPSIGAETGLNVSYSAGDNFYAKTTAPNPWTTAATGNRISGSLYFQIV